MTKIRSFIAVAIALMMTGSAAQAFDWNEFNTWVENVTATRDADLTLPSEESLIVRPESFGAVADGIVDCTAAIAAAIEACPQGGVVLLDGKGTYLSAMITLKSDMTLYISEGSTLLSIPQDMRNLAEDEAELYPAVPMLEETGNITFATNHDGSVLFNPRAFIYAHNAKNLKIAGKGIINGNGNFNPWTWWGGDPDELERPVPILLPLGFLVDLMDDSQKRVPWV